MWFLSVRDLVNQLLKWFCRCWVTLHTVPACSMGGGLVPVWENRPEGQLKTLSHLRRPCLKKFRDDCMLFGYRAQTLPAYTDLFAAKDQVMAVSPSFPSVHPQVCLPLLSVAVGIYKNYRTCIVLQTSILAAKFKGWMGFKLLGRRHPRMGG